MGAQIGEAPLIECHKIMRLAPMGEKFAVTRDAHRGNTATTRERLPIEGGLLSPPSALYARGWFMGQQGAKSGIVGCDVWLSRELVSTLASQTV